MSEEGRLPLKSKCGRKPNPNAISKSKDYFREYWRQKREYVVCDCGNQVMKCFMSKHIKTSKHDKFMKIVKEKNQQENVIQV